MGCQGCRFLSLVVVERVLRFDVQNISRIASPSVRLGPFIFAEVAWEAFEATHPLLLFLAVFVSLVFFWPRNFLVVLSVFCLFSGLLGFAR